MEKKIIEDFAAAWRTLNPELIIQHLADNFIYDSQWVFAYLDCNGYKDYIRQKFNAIKEKGSQPDVEIVPDSVCGGMMLKLTQFGESIYYRIKMEDGKVIKADLCMF